MGVGDEGLCEGGLKGDALVVMELGVIAGESGL